MSYGYGGRPNPFDQRGDGATSYAQPTYNAPAQSYGRQQYGGGPTMGRDDYAGQNVEMAPLVGQNNSGYGRQDPNRILNDCRDIDAGIDEADIVLKDLKSLQNKVINDANASPDSTLTRQLEGQSSQLMSLYRDLVGKIKNIKQQPESGLPKNAPQVQRVDRKLKGAMEAYRNSDADYRRRLQEQIARQYRIVRPDASEQEVRYAVDNPDQQQVFQQAMMNSNRQGQAQSTLNAVRSRHEAIQNIERQMIELAELFTEMDNLVVQQEAAVVNIELKGEEVVDNMDKGNQEIGTAIVHARNTRKWKWWCLCICVLIILIIAIVVVVWYFVFGPGANKSNKKKRFILDAATASHRVLSGQAWSPSKAAPVVPGKDFVGEGSRRLRRFIA